MKYSDTYQIKLTNIPLINLRETFDNSLQFVKSDSFKAILNNSMLDIATASGFRWSHPTASFITELIQAAIQGVESYLPGVVRVRTGNKNSQNPWKLGGRTLVDNYFHELPALIDPSCSLKLSNNSLWDRNIKFYKEIRNPLFHGHEIDTDVDISCFIGLFAHIKELYDWIDGWHHPDLNLPPKGSLIRAAMGKA